MTKFKYKVVLQNPEVVKDTLYQAGRFAARCKTTDNDKDLSREAYERIGKHCFSSGHMTPFMHINWLFSVIDVSRVYSHQQVRHHSGININQLSGVFTKEENLAEHFVVPPTVQAVLTNNKEVEDALKEAIAASDRAYNLLLSKGVPNSDARYIIPQGQATSLNIGVNPVEAVHICHERLCNHAQWEIRAVWHEIARQVAAIDPFWKEYLVPKCVYLHGCNEKPSCGYYQAYTHPQVEIKDFYEDRTTIHTCTRCEAKLMLKDDDPYPYMEPFLCRRCATELGVNNGDE